MLDETYTRNYHLFLALAAEAGVFQLVQDANLVFVPPPHTYACFDMTDEKVKKGFVLAHVSKFDSHKKILKPDFGGHCGVATADGTIHRVNDGPMLHVTDPPRTLNPDVDRIVDVVFSITKVEKHAVHHRRVLPYDADTNPSALRFLLYPAHHLCYMKMQHRISDQVVYDKAFIPGVGLDIGCAHDNVASFVKVSLYSADTHHCIRAPPVPSPDLSTKEKTKFAFSRTGTVFCLRNHEKGYREEDGRPRGSNTYVDKVKVSMPAACASDANKLCATRTAKWYHRLTDSKSAGAHINYLKISLIPPQLLMRELSRAKTDEERRQVRLDASKQHDAYGGTANNEYYFVFHMLDAEGDVVAFLRSNKFELRNSQNVLSEEEKRKRNSFWIEERGPGGFLGGRMDAHSMEERREMRNAKTRKLHAAVSTAIDALVELAGQLPSEACGEEESE